MPARAPIAVTLVNDYEVVVEGLRSMLQPFGDRIRFVELVADAPSRAPADIALYDTFATELAFGPEVKARRRVLYTVDTSERFLRAALASGAAGVLPKSLQAGELVDALERISDGEEVIIAAKGGGVPRGAWPGKAAAMSEREAEIVALITRGLSNEEIALITFLSMNTVKSYIRTAYRKIGVSTRSQAVIWGVEHGFAHHPVRELPPDES